MKNHSFLAGLMTLASLAACESEFANSADYVVTAPPILPVTLTVQGDNQGSLREFPLSNNALRYRAFIEALPNERYTLNVTNNSDQRVGLVIAVDGRNIISGKKSWLGNNEKMYILNPHESANYEGWRTSANQTNRFYFTAASNSYAAAWGDNSAMGVIAMAVYAERVRVPIYDSETKQRGVTGSGVLAPAPAADAAAPPGTGFGETTYSPSTSVSFEPNTDAMEKLVLKYEWRETLCQKRILPDCQRGENSGNNRLWNDNDGFAPPPPGRR
jgi:hypothetical protein